MAGTYEVTRSTAIAAPPAEVYAELIDFHRWQDWSPWEGMDPNQQRVFSGAPSGTGAKYAWKGNRRVGEGSMEIIDTVPPAKVTVDLRFLKPFRSIAETRFLVEPQGEGSLVTWTMEGRQTVMTRLMGVFKSMDSLVGPDFEKGLARLRTVVESTR